MSYKFVLFEGVSCSGKTTLSRLLASTLNCYYSTTPTYPLMLMKKAIDRLSLYYIRYLYYFIGNYVASKKFKRLLKHNHLICDRYTYSTAVYHSVLVDRDFKIPKYILKPDLIIYTYAPFEEIEKRLNNRETRNKYEYIEFLKKVDKKYRDYLKDENVVYIDTSAKSSDEIVSDLKKLLSS